VDTAANDLFLIIAPRASLVFMIIVQMA
jgi:hypothetical protein